MKKLYTFIFFLLTTSLFAQDLVMTVTVPPGTTQCRFSGPFWGWDPAGGPVGVDNGNDTFTFILSPAPGADMEYLFTLDGVAYENLIDNAQNAECTDRVNSGNMVTDFFGFANRVWKTTDALTWNEVYDDCIPATLSISQVEKLNYTVSPNPSSNDWNVQSQQTIQNVSIFDVLGKRVLEINPNTSEFVINSSGLPKGLYFAKMATEFGSSSIKLIKQ